MSFFTFLDVNNKNTIPFPEKSTSTEDEKSGSSFIVESAPIIVRKESRKEIQKTQYQVDIEHECDILRVDSIIRAKLSRESSEILNMYSELENFLWIINNSTDPVDAIQAKTRVTSLRNKIQDIEQGFDLLSYVSQSEPILTQYKRILREQSNREFVGVQTRDMSVEIQKTHLVQSFLRIAQNFIKINRNGSSSVMGKGILYCLQCFSIEFTTDTDNGEKICKNCALSIQTFEDTPCFKDSDRVNMSSRYKYLCKSHFIAEIDQLEGKQNSNITKVADTIQAEMENYNLSEENLTKNQISMFLSDKRINNHYKDINLIHLKLTGKKPPDISSLRDILLKMYDKFQKVYEEIKSPNRQSSLNVKFILRNLLKLLDFNQSDDSPPSLKTPAKIKEHTEKWNETVVELKKRYPNDKTQNGKPMWRQINVTI
jgi:hypothetical protein